jgi:HK97 family phage major capsid protein
METHSNPPVLTRSAEIRKVNRDRRVEVSFSSETPYQRWFGMEILGHNDGEINLERLKNGAAVLLNHKTDEHVGVVERVWITGQTGRAIIRFGKSAKANEAFQDVEDGILKHISVGYFVKEMIPDGDDTYRVIDWEPFEISLVAVPADPSVGVGRTDEQIKFEGYFRMENQTRSQQIEEKSGGHNAAVKSERRRCAELAKIGELYKAEDLARDAIDSGASVDSLNHAILERRGMSVTKAETADIGMSRNEIGQFSISRAIMAKADPDNYARHAGFEMECSRAVEQTSTGNLQGNIHIPADVMLAQRDLSVGVAADGGNLVATNLMAGNFIDLLRNESAIMQAGATYIPGLVGNVAIPRQTAGETIYWLAEGGTPTKSSATFDQVTLSPKTVGAYTEMSRRILKQSTPYAEALVIQSLAASIAQGIDTAAISGTGANNQPTGILNVAGIGDVAGGTNGAAPAWDDVVELETDVAVANADTNKLAYVTNSKVRGIAKRTFIDAGSGQRLWDVRTPQAPLNGYRTVVSNTVPSNVVKGTSGAVCSSLIFGNWADLLIGMWGSLDLQVNPYSLDTAGAVRITSFQDVDVAVRHAASFSAMQDVLTV